MLTEIEQVQKTAQLLHTEAEVEAAITKMAEQINQELNGTNPILLSVMNGGLVVAGKLLTQLDFPLTVDAVNASRYGNQTNGSEIHWKQKPASDLAGRVVLLVDDILDEGITLEAVYQYCKEQGASKIYSAVLIDKKINKAKPISAVFIGLKVEDHYLYGYGMDYKGYLRNAAGIYACV